MDNSIFINRVKEKSLLSDQLQQSSLGSRFILISGPTGRGKSALVNEVVSKIRLSSFARVKTIDHEKYRDVDGYFILEMGRALDKFARENVSALSSSDISKRDVVETVINTARLAFIDYVKKKTGSQTLSDSLENLIKRAGKDNFDAVFSGHDELYQPIKRYINEFLNESEFTIAIENIQNIDKDSLEFLRALMHNHRGLKLIAEYTNSENVIFEDTILLDYIGAAASFSYHHELGMLPVSEIIKHLAQDSSALVDVFESSYSTSNGNLYKLSFILKSTKHRSVFSSNLDIEKAFQLSLNTLSGNNKMLFSIIVSHGGNVSKDLLREMISKSHNVRKTGLQYRDTEEALKSLVREDILKVDGDSVSLKHDSALQSVISNESFSRQIIIANDEWLNFYISLKRSSSQDFLIPLTEILGWELYFRAQLDVAEGLSETLDNIYKLCLKSRAPKRTIKYAKNIRDRLAISPHSSSAIVKETDLHLARIFYRLAMFDEVIEYSKPHLKNTGAFLICATSSLLSGNKDFAAELLNAETRTSDKTDIRWLGSQLVKIGILRASNEYDKCSELWHSLHNQGVFKGTILETMFLRSSDMALIEQEQERNKFLNFAIKKYHESGDFIQEMGARIALSQHLGYKGFLEQAEEQLRESEKLAEEIISDYFIINNNLAVISLFRGIADADCLIQLDGANQRCENYLDKLIILNNLLIWHAMNNSITEIQSIQNGIDEILTAYADIDFDLKRIALFNIAMSYDQNRLRKLYLDQAKSLPLLADEQYWRAKLYDEQPNQGDFRLLHKFYPVFISSWNLDFDIELKNF